MNFSRKKSEKCLGKTHTVQAFCSLFAGKGSFCNRLVNDEKLIKSAKRLGFDVIKPNNN